MDFYCPELKVVIELDGAIHNNQVIDDQERDALLTEAGIHILRLPSHLVLKNINQALKRIIKFCNLYQ